MPQKSFAGEVTEGVTATRDDAMQVAIRHKGVTMRRKPPSMDIEAEAPEVAEIRASIGKQVPIRSRYVRGERPTLVAIDGDACTLRFANGVTMLGVPIKDLVDDSGYWK